MSGIIVSEDEHDLREAVLALGVLHPLADEPALLQDANRSEVVTCDVRVEWTLGDDVQERGERSRRHTLSPVLLADPVADEADAVLAPAPFG